MSSTPNLENNWDEFRHEYDYPIITNWWEENILFVKVEIPARHWNKDWEGNPDSLPSVYHSITYRLDPKKLYMLTRDQSVPVYTPTKEWITEQVRNNPTMPPAQDSLIQFKNCFIKCRPGDEGFYGKHPPLVIDGYAIIPLSEYDPE